MAIVVNTDSISWNVLSVICVRIKGKDLPLTILGTPFGATAFRYANIISAFLNRPLMEKDRIVVNTLEDLIQDDLGHILFDGKNFSNDSSETEKL